MGHDQEATRLHQANFDHWVTEGMSIETTVTKGTIAMVKISVIDIISVT